MQKQDIAALVGKGLLGAIPFVGPMVAEVVGEIIPNQRIDRLEALLLALEDKLEGMDQPALQDRFTRPEQVDLLEDAFIQASRAMSDERKQYLAALLKNSLSEEDLRHLEYKRLLSLLGQLNDAQVIILKYYALTRMRTEGHREFFEAHKDLIVQQPLAFGSSDSAHDRNAILESFRWQLLEAGLLQPKFKKPKRGELPEFDEKTGMVKQQGFSISRLGRMLLRVIDEAVEGTDS
jgi:hypothetical protein